MLAEQGVDITLRRYQAYETAAGETILSVSQTYPPTDVASFVAAPRAAPATPKPDDLPQVPWTIEDFLTLVKLGFPVPMAALSACSEAPDTWVPSGAIYARAGVTSQSGAGQLAGFGYSVRTRFKRANHPWETQWKAGGENANYYRVAAPTAQAWLEALEVSEGHGEATRTTESATDFHDD
ncbi:MAG: hypothetical protein FJ035_01450 [Chloroflexi bacterium]|nr:hypothetical protein [Chloroflexota bacterium]